MDVRTTEMGFNLVLLKRGDLRGFPPLSLVPSLVPRFIQTSFGPAPVLRMEQRISSEEKSRARPEQTARAQ